jgi:hypothetical protein
MHTLLPVVVNRVMRPSARALLNQIAILPALIVTLTAASLMMSSSATAAPLPQSAVPDFVLNAQTIISVTVAVSDGQVIVVPVDLTFIAQNRSGQTNVALIADVEQQAGMFIGVSPSNAIDATINLPQSGGSTAVATPEAPAQPVNNGEGTHVTNTNSRLRAGPGTNFEQVGRVPQGGIVTVVGQNEDGSWYQLDSGAWIAEFLVEPIENGGNTQEQDEPDTAEADEQVAAAPKDLPTYLAEIEIVSVQTNAAVEAIASLLNNAQTENGAWRTDMAAQITTLTGALDQFLALIPPPGYQDLVAEVTNVALACEQAADYISTGLNDPRGLEVGVATGAIQSCGAQSANLAAYAATIQ